MVSLSLEKKSEKLFPITNKNDIIEILGPPSTTRFFDNELWIYIERKNSTKLSKT